MSNVGYAYNWLIDKGLSPNAAAGVVGNLVAESGVNPLSNQQGGPGRGIAQWSEGGRWETLKAWAGNRDINSLETQMGFLWHELNTGYSGVLQKLQNTTNMAQATEIFMKEFEIPADTSPAAVQGRVNQADIVRDTTKVKGGDTTAGNGNGNGGGDKQNAGDFKAALAAAGWPAYLIEQFPELEKIFKEAINKDWTSTRFVGEVMNSRFYQNRSDDMLNWDKMRESEQNDAIKETTATLADQAAAMGIQIGDKRLRGLATAINRFGMNESQVRDLIARELDKKDVPQGGTVGTAMDQIQQVAWDWGVNMSKEMTNRWEQKIASGDADVGAFKDMAEARARKDYHWLRESFDAGETLGSIADPYRQSMASLLEISPNAISMKDKQIRKALSYTTGKGKKAEEGLAPLWQFEDELRKDPRWAVTSNARESAMNFGTKILQDFGVIA